MFIFFWKTYPQIRSSPEKRPKKNQKKNKHSARIEITVMVRTGRLSDSMFYH